jgi:hypothetical protein
MAVLSLLTSCLLDSLLSFLDWTLDTLLDSLDSVLYGFSSTMQSLTQHEHMRILHLDLKPHVARHATICLSIPMFI